MMEQAAAALGSWPAFLVLFALSGLCFGYLVPKAKAPIFARLAAERPRKVLDESFPSWSAQEAERFFAAIGPEGRAAYRRFYWIMDFWFPGALAALATASLLLIAFPPGSGLAWLCALATLSWLFDVAENITHFWMAGRYPHLSPLALNLGPFFTGGKWLFAILPLPIAAAGLVLRYPHGW